MELLFSFQFHSDIGFCFFCNFPLTVIQFYQALRLLNVLFFNKFTSYRTEEWGIFTYMLSPDDEQLIYIEMRLILTKIG